MSVIEISAGKKVRQVVSRPYLPLGITESG